MTTLSSGWDLQKSIHATLTSDPAVTTLLGGVKVYDRAPRNASLPYLTFGQSVTREWGTSSDEGEEHILTLHVWSEGGGQRETQEIMGAVRKALNSAALPLESNRLVNMRHEFSDARREIDGEVYHGILRYRAVTEPAN